MVFLIDKLTPDRRVSLFFEVLLGESPEIAVESLMLYLDKVPEDYKVRLIELAFEVAAEFTICELAFHIDKVPETQRVNLIGRAFEIHKGTRAREALVRMLSGKPELASALASRLSELDLPLRGNEG